MSEALIWGFADLGRAVAGLAWRYGDDSAGVLMVEGEVSAAEVAFERDEELRLAWGDWFASAAFKPQTEFGLRSGASGRVGLAEVELGRRALVCPAQISRVPGELLDDSELLRHLSAPPGEEGQLICSARRPLGVAEHGDEEVEAIRLGSEGEQEEFGEVLLSTQYDGDGSPTRIGLELWPREEGEVGPMRAAGVAIGATHSEHTSAVLLDVSCEGRKGIGSYLIWRR
jgi:hypothetical protein